MTRHLTPDYQRHAEIARAKVRDLITHTYQDLQSLAGWMDAAGYDAHDMQRAHDAVRTLGALYDTIVVVHEEAEVLSIEARR